MTFLSKQIAADIMGMRLRVRRRHVLSLRVAGDNGGNVERERVVRGRRETAERAAQRGERAQRRAPREQIAQQRAQQEELQIDAREVGVRNALRVCVSTSTPMRGGARKRDAN